ncbi:putative pre-mRNA-splicing factor ATP-dependent RNA helicase DHX16 [Centruroides vittatus]|uniref:putative pre-mRNA-splicing factor ATP-dependent RNA helicase DHX16 n=1 Tax=Centruroides vittatus TaxID=120091 RepID=UPI00350FB401
MKRILSKIKKDKNKSPKLSFMDFINNASSESMSKQSSKLDTKEVTSINREVKVEDEFCSDSSNSRNKEESTKSGKSKVTQLYEFKNEDFSDTVLSNPSSDANVSSASSDHHSKKFSDETSPQDSIFLRTKSQEYSQNDSEETSNTSKEEVSFVNRNLDNLQNQKAKIIRNYHTVNNNTLLEDQNESSETSSSNEHLLTEVKEKLSRKRMKSLNNKSRQKLLKDLISIITDILKEDDDDEMEESSNDRRRKDHQEKSIEYKDFVDFDETNSKPQWKKEGKNQSNGFNFENLENNENLELFASIQKNLDKTTNAEEMKNKQNPWTKNVKYMSSVEENGSSSDCENDTQEERSESKELSVVFPFRDRNKTFQIGDYILTVASEGLNSAQSSKNQNLSGVAINIHPNPHANDSSFNAKFQVSQFVPEHTSVKNANQLEDIVKPFSDTNTNIVVMPSSKVETKKEEPYNIKKSSNSKIQPERFTSPDKKSSLLFRMQDVLSSREYDTRPTVIAVPAQDRSNKSHEHTKQTDIAAIVIAPGRKSLSTQIKHSKNPEEKKWSKFARDVIKTLPSSVTDKPIVIIFPSNSDEFNHKNFPVNAKNVTPLVFVPPAAQFSEREIIGGEVSENFSTNVNQAVIPTIVVMPSSSKHTLVKVDCTEPFKVSTKNSSYPSIQNLDLQESKFSITQNPCLGEVSSKNQPLKDSLLLTAEPREGQVRQQNIKQGLVSQAPERKSPVNKSYSPPKIDEIQHIKAPTMKYAMPKTSKKKGMDICYYGHEKCNDIHVYAHVLVDVPKKDELAESSLHEKLDEKRLRKLTMQKYPRPKPNKKGVKICYYGHEKCDDLHAPSYVIVTTPEFGKKTPEGISGRICEDSSPKEKSKKSQEVKFSRANGKSSGSMKLPIDDHEDDNDDKRRKKRAKETKSKKSQTQNKGWFSSFKK